MPKTTWTRRKPNRPQQIATRRELQLEVRSQSAKRPSQSPPKRLVWVKGFPIYQSGFKTITFGSVCKTDCISLIEPTPPKVSKTS